MTTPATTTRRAAIVSPVRTPVGTFGGSLRAVPVEELAATAIKALLERTGIDPELIDDVSFAQSYVNGETPCIGRWAALHAGLPVSVPGFQIDRHHQGRSRRLRRPQPPARRGGLGRGPVRRRGGPGPGAAAARRPGGGQPGRGRAARLDG